MSARSGVALPFSMTFQSGTTNAFGAAYAAIMASATCLSHLHGKQIMFEMFIFALVDCTYWRSVRASLRLHWTGGHDVAGSHSHESNGNKQMNP